MREFWFFSFKWWITVPLWHEFWPMAAAGLHIQDQGRLFRMSSGVCQTIKVSEFYLYNIYHVPVKVFFFCSFFRDRGMMACLQILDHAGKEKWNQVPFYWSATILTPPPSLFHSNLNHGIIPVMVLSVYVQLCREKLSIKLGSISI